MRCRQGFRPIHRSMGVALVGAGGLARWDHLPNLKKIPDVNLRAVHSASGPRGKSYAKRFGADYCATDYQEILNDPAIAVVVITSRNQHHASQASSALRAGKHVFVEKPMAITEPECADLMEAVQAVGQAAHGRLQPPFCSVLPGCEEGALEAQRAPPC